MVANCIGKPNSTFPKGPDPDLLLEEGGFGCRAVRKPECTLSEKDYKRGYVGMNKPERLQWMKDIEEKWYYLEKLPQSECPVKKKKPRKRRHLDDEDDIVEDDEVIDGNGPAAEGSAGPANAVGVGGSGGGVAAEGGSVTSGAVAAEGGAGAGDGS